jgi:hypothetical protein
MIALGEDEPDSCAEQLVLCAQNVERRPLAGLRLFSYTIKCALPCFDSPLRCDDLGLCGPQASSVGAHESHHLGVRVRTSLQPNRAEWRACQAPDRLPRGSHAIDGRLRLGIVAATIAMIAKLRAILCMTFSILLGYRADLDKVTCAPCRNAVRARRMRLAHAVDS